MNFALGDRVQYPNEDWVNYPKLRGLKGTALSTFMFSEHFVTSVRWDVEIPGGWDCDGLCEEGYGWNVSTEDLIPLPPQSEVSAEPLDLNLEEVL